MLCCHTSFYDRFFFLAHSNPNLSHPFVQSHAKNASKILLIAVIIWWLFLFALSSFLAGFHISDHWPKSCKVCQYHYQCINRKCSYTWGIQSFTMTPRKGSDEWMSIQSSRKKSSITYWPSHRTVKNSHTPLLYPIYFCEPLWSRWY